MIPVTAFAGKKVALFGLGARGSRARARCSPAAPMWSACDDSDATHRQGDAPPAFRPPICASIDWIKIAALVLAPGVPLTHPAPHWTVGLARNAAVEVIGDIELFCRERRAHRAAMRRSSPSPAPTASRPPRRWSRICCASAGYDAQLGGNIGTAILSLEPPAPGRVARDRVLVVPDRSRALARSVDRHPAQRHRGSSRPPRHAGRTTRRSRSGWSRACSASGTAIVGVDDNWCQAVADRIEPRRQARGARLGAPAARRRHLCRGRPRSCARPAAPRARSRSSAASARCAARTMRRTPPARPRAALALGLDAEAIQKGLRVVSRPRAPHGAGRPQGQRAVRQQLQGDQCGRGGARARELHRHLLDRGRQGRRPAASRRSPAISRASARPI